MKGETWLSYKERLRELSDRLVRAQRPIRLLDAINWDDETQKQVFAGKFKKLPKIDQTWYQEKKPLGFDVSAKLEELEDIKRDVAQSLGREDELGAILIRNCDEYQGVVRMLAARGTQEFHTLSRSLFGSPKDHFLDEKTTVRELGHHLYDILGGIDDRELGVRYEKNLTADQVVQELNARFEVYFHDHQVHVILSGRHRVGRGRRIGLCEDSPRRHVLGARPRHPRGA
jgi:hypothetical protein